MPRITYVAVDGRGRAIGFSLSQSRCDGLAPCPGQAKSEVKACFPCTWGIRPGVFGLRARWKYCGGWPRKCTFVIPLLYHSIRLIYLAVMWRRLMFVF